MCAAVRKVIHILATVMGFCFPLVHMFHMLLLLWGTYVGRYMTGRPGKDRISDQKVQDGLQKSRERHQIVSVTDGDLSTVPNYGHHRVKPGRRICSGARVKIDIGLEPQCN